MDSDDYNPILPLEGLHVLHLFFEVDHASWDLLNSRQRMEAKTTLTALAADIRAIQGTQLFSFSMVSPKADLGFLLVTPDLHECDRLAKRLATSLGADNLAPVFSWLSMTESAQASGMGQAQDAGAFESFPDWPVFCFFPAATRRGTNSEAREILRETLVRVGSEQDGRIAPLITESTGLEQADWGVTLFARSTSDVRKAVSALRYAESAAAHGEFGEVYLGIQLPLDALFRRLDL